MKPKKTTLRLLCLMLLLLIGASGLHAQVDYLCFTADEAGHVKLSVTGSITADIQTSTDGINWTAYTFGTDINLAAGDSVFFKGNYHGSIDNYARFVMSGKIRASGNIMTLTDGDNPTLSLAGKDFCFYRLFYNCEALISAPELPATTLAKGCYFDMFNTCTSLMNAPALPAETLAEECYVRMFQNCLSLTETPALPAKTLAVRCYNSMFANCEALTRLPELPATNLTAACYHSLFKECTGITLYEDGIGPTWGIPANAQPAKEWNFIMLNGTGGTFTGDPVIGTDYYYTPLPACLTFSSTDTFTVTPSEVLWNGQLFYSTNMTDWESFTITGAAAADNGTGTYTLHIRGTNNTRINGYNKPGWVIDAAGEVACSGSFEALLDYPKVDAGEHPEMDVYCFGNLFKDCAALVSAPPLTATKLNTGCYFGMFRNCTGLKAAPALPEIKMFDFCYADMFRGCTSLTQAPVLPVTELANYCYQYMFKGCTSLTQAPVLPAQTLAGSCYQGMFEGCTSLAQAPVLSADTLGSTCYDSMFKGCTSLTQAPVLPATTLESRCYCSMFEDCISLTQAPELPALTMTGNCYEQMFDSCIVLTTAPELPATTLAFACYQKMFKDCTALTEAPSLPADSLADISYLGMFEDCTNLTTPPALPADTLGWACYAEMFKGCTRLTQAPELPATNLIGWCYNAMFKGCTGLTRLPELPATNLVEWCYNAMFENCTGITLYENGTGQTWGIPNGADASNAWNWNEKMFAGTGGTFTGNPEIGTDYYYTPLPASVGVTINGIELYEAGSSGEGWSYVLPTLTLTNAGPFTISGTNTAGQVCVVVAAGVTSEVTLSNLTLAATGNQQCPFALESGANVSLFLAGTNTLTSGNNRAGLEVSAGRTLSITNAPGDDAGALTATGGEYGAGIGGGNNGACGTVTINGGIVTANGSEFFGAGIGGGGGGGGGTVTINGGTVTANGGEMGAGIGSGGYAGSDGGNGGTVNISGGNVTAMGGNWSAGIGGGDGDAGGTVNISGGTVTATGGQYGAGIGGGNNDGNPDGIAGTGGTVNISGGHVIATGGKCAAGIGGGTGQQLAGSAGAALSVSGGTLFAIGGAGGAPGVGGGLGNVEEGDTGNAPDISGSNHFTGGSIRIDGDFAMAASSNGTACVWCVTVPKLTPNASVVITSLGTYGVNDLFADNNGKLYLWLPNDNYDFTAGGTEYEATVSDADTTATAKAPPVLDAYLTFSSADTFKITPSAVSWNGELFYSTDATNWNAFTRDGATAANNGAGEFRLYFRGKNNTLITGGNLSYWIIDADTASVACSGNIETLLDYTIVEAGNHPTMAAICFSNLFKNCTALSSAPELAATNLSNNCYVRMFMGCTGLTAAPALPATTVTGGCYQEMFEGCTSLTQAPVLPAMTLISSCYREMFYGCTALTTAPELPATTLAPACYQEMFSGCTSLTNAPALPAMTLAAGCYIGMFSGCTGLTAPPELPAMTLNPFCYNEMFSGCTSLTSLPELPATTLAISCYRSMFENCTGIKLSTTGPGLEWSIPANADATGATDWNLNMFAGTGGAFTGNPEIGTTYYLPAYELWICGVQVTSANKDNLSAIPGVSAGTASYNPDTQTLTLNNVMINKSGDQNIIKSSIDGLIIEVVGENNLTANGWSLIDVNNNSTIQGNGTLNIENTRTNDFGINVDCASDTLTIKDCTVNVTSPMYGIRGTGYETLIFDNAAVTAKGTSNGSIYGFKEIKFDNCQIIEPEGAVFNPTQKAICYANGTIVKDTVKIEPTATSIDKLVAHTVTFYPNPVRDILHIQAEKAVTAVRIYNIHGAVVTQAAGDIREINLTHLPAGIYMVRAEIGERVSTMRIIKEQ